jgi:acetolactate synthase-1/2/3 large subunit
LRKSNSVIRTGGSVLAESLALHKAKHVFIVPGESFLGALDAFSKKKKDIKIINARHEAGASNMAEAYGKLTGKPGIAYVTRGPGACHASVGVHIAFQDSTPMILLVGDISRNLRDREAFQEVDFKSFFSPISKWVAEINDPDRVPEYINRAFSLATSGVTRTTGPGLPEVAKLKALLIYSGTLSGSFISATHFDIGLKKLLKSTSWNASLSLKFRDISPTRRIIGVLS